MLVLYAARVHSNIYNNNNNNNNIRTQIEDNCKHVRNPKKECFRLLLITAQ